MTEVRLNVTTGKNYMKTTILGGLIFIAPLAMMAILFTKVYQFSMVVVDPIDKLIPIQTIAGVALVNLLAILLILVVCFLCGLLAKTAFLAAKVNVVDGFLIDLIPGYAVAKGVIGSVAQEDDVAALLSPVIVRFDDYDQIAFEIERDESRAVIFLPGAPSTWAGSTVIVDIARVRKIDVPTHHTVKLMRVLGRGSLQLEKGKLSENKA